MEAKEFENSFVKGAIKLCSQCKHGCEGRFYDGKHKNGPWIPQCLQHQFTRIFSKPLPEGCALRLELATCKKEVLAYLKRHCKIHYIVFRRKNNNDEVLLGKILASGDGVRVGHSLFNRHLSSGQPGKHWVYNKCGFESFDNDCVKLLAHGDFRKVYPIWWKGDHKRRLRNSQEAVEAAKEDLRHEQEKLAKLKAEKPK